MPKHEEKLSLDDLELTTEEAAQVKGGAQTPALTQVFNLQGLVAGPRPDQSLVFGPRPDQMPIDVLSTLDFTNIFTR